MYRLEKKARDHDKFLGPSFSSSLLDQIYRSIDEGDRKNDDTKFYRETTGNKIQWTEPTDRKDNNNKLRRSEKVVVETEMDQDVLFFSSTSVSSDSSFGGFSSSDTESLYGTRSSRASSCMPKPKPVRTSVSFRLDQKSGTRMFDDDGFCRNSKAKKGTAAAVTRDEDALLIKNKSRALKIYNNLKKVKQPISPGGRLTSFLNSLFATGNGKKKKSGNKKGTCEDANQASSMCCSSASSFSRSCLSKTKTTPSSERDGNKTVRFYPAEEEAARDFLKEYRTHNQKKNDLVVLKDLPIRTKINHDVDDDDDDYDDDAASCASSDLFELDHLAVFGNGRYCEELPVYETTHVSTNRAIANGLIA